MSSNVLAARDINTSAPTMQSNLDNKATSTSTADNVKSMDYHRQVLQSRIAEERGTQTYVSPSDTIMSPCTAKLSAMKNKRFASAKPQSLFAKTSSKSLGASGASGASATLGLGDEKDEFGA